MKPSILWVTDPWDTLDHSRDTSLRWMEECSLQGIETHWCDVRSVQSRNGKTLLTSSRLKKVQGQRSSEAFQFASARTLAPEAFSRIVYRVDPPVDLKYLHPLQLLTYGLGKKADQVIANPPSVIFASNEKMEGGVLPRWSPRSLVTSQWREFLAFGRKEKTTVLKPLHQAQSKGIELLQWTSPSEIDRSQTLLRTATDGFQQLVLLQQYLPQILKGEQRLWFLNGKLIACARKKPRAGEFKIDMDQGGSVVATHLDSKEKEAVRKISTVLRAKKIRLAAVDLIHGLVTDFNITSPGLICQMESVTKKNLSAAIVNSLIKPWR